MGERVKVTLPLRVYCDVEVEASWDEHEGYAEIHGISLPMSGHIHSSADSLSDDDRADIDEKVRVALGVRGDS